MGDSQLTDLQAVLQAADGCAYAAKDAGPLKLEVLLQCVGVNLSGQSVADPTCRAWALQSLQEATVASQGFGPALPLLNGCRYVSPERF